MFKLSESPWNSTLSASVFRRGFVDTRCLRGTHFTGYLVPVVTPQNTTDPVNSLCAYGRSGYEIHVVPSVVQAWCGSAQSRTVLVVRPWRSPGRANLVSFMVSCLFQPPCSNTRRSYAV